MENKKIQNTNDASSAENQTGIPSVFLRKPFYLILQHFKEFPEKYIKTWNTDIKAQSKLITIEVSTDNRNVATTEYIKTLASHIHVVKGSIKIDNSLDIYSDISEEDFDNIQIPFVCSIEQKAKAKLFIGQILEQVIGLGKSKPQIPYDNNRGGIFSPLYSLCANIQTNNNSIILQSKMIKGVTNDKVQRIYKYIREVIIPDNNNQSEKTKLIHELNFLEEKWQTHISNLKSNKEYNTDKEDINKAYNLGKSLLKITQEEKDALKELINSRWLIFQRTDIDNEEAFNRGYSVSCLTIFDFNKDSQLSARVTSKYQNQNGVVEDIKFLGIVSIDLSSGYIILSLRKEESQYRTFAFFVLRIDSTGLKAQNLLIGHHVYYSAYFKKSITKVVCALRFDQKTENVKSKYEIPDFEPQDFTRKVTDKEVPQPIRRYLANRMQNRLTMPEKIISFLGGRDRSLEAWLNPKIGQAANDTKLQACAGSYRIYYYHGDIEVLKDYNDNKPEYVSKIFSNIREDLFNIQYDSDLVEYKASFHHVRGNDTKVLHKGSVSRRGNTIEAVLENRNKPNTKNTESNYVFLLFSIPNFEKNIFPVEFKKNEYSFLPGIITGLNDESLNPISLLALVVKNVHEVEEKDYKHELKESERVKIVQYFAKNSDNVKVVVNPTFNLSNSFIPSNLEWFRSIGGVFSIGEKVECLYNNEVIFESSNCIRGLNNMLLEADAFIAHWFKKNKR